MISAEDAKRAPEHKIHVLGHDARSSFIAHALSSVYDSVSLLSWQPNPKARYKNVQLRRDLTPGARDHYPPERMSKSIKMEAVDKDKSRINDLIISATATEAVAGLKKLEDRLDENSRVCILHEGLGVLDEVRHNIFNDRVNGVPVFYEGHMSHKIVYSRMEGGLVKELKPGSLTMYRKKFRNQDLLRLNADVEARHKSLDLVRSLKSLPELGTKMGGLQEWLGAKLPSVVFNAVVEPICVMYDMRYEELLENRPALRMMTELLHEVLEVISNAPEMQDSDVIRNFVSDDTARKCMLYELHARRSITSELATRLQLRLPNDVRHTTDYMRRRGLRMGLAMPKTSMMVDMVLAKEKQVKAKLESAVPLEYSSDLQAFGYERFGYNLVFKDQPGVA